MRVHGMLLTFIAAAAIVVCLASSAYPAVKTESVALCHAVVRGASVSFVVVDLDDPGVMIDIGLPAKGISHSEPFASFVKRDAPIAAVTGTYFDTRTLIPTGTIVSGGQMVFENHIGAAVCFSPDNRARFVDARFGEACDLGGAESGVRTGPRLLANGEYALDPAREGFHHPGLFGARTRMVLGVTAHHKLLLAHVRTPITFSKLAGIMKVLGARDAICLDGGTSSAMYYRGQMIQRPGRMLTNIIEVRERPAPRSPLSPTILSKTTDRGAAIRSSYGRIEALMTTQQNGRNEEPAIAEQVAVLFEPAKLRFAKGLHTLFPVNRA